MFGVYIAYSFYVDTYCIERAYKLRNGNAVGPSDNFARTF